MACYHPLQAWRDKDGAVKLTHHRWRDVETFQLPCGRCLGCRADRARSWALRCQLELQDHHSATFTTLTYDDKHLPWTLQKHHLQLWLKRFRKALGPARPIRFFASGEYGEQTGRPHYHALLFGAHRDDQYVMERTWGMGHVRNDHVTPATIAYVAGYVNKKIGWRQYAAEHDRVDLETGEVYEWQPPFNQMSRRPGIGSKARDKYTDMWRDHTIDLPRGASRPPAPRHVPRYLHDGWLKTASDEQKEELELERYERALTRNANRNLSAMEAHHIKKIEIQADRRKL